MSSFDCTLVQVKEQYDALAGTVVSWESQVSIEAQEEMRKRHNDFEERVAVLDEAVHNCFYLLIKAIHCRYLILPFGVTVTDLREKWVERI